MTKKKQQLNNTRHAFLLTLFNDKDEYTELEVNGFWLVKQWI